MTKRFSFSQLVLLVAALVLAVIWLAPIAWAVATSLKPESETTKLPLEWIGNALTFDSYALVLETGGIVKWAINSTVTSVIVTFLTVLFSAMAAYGFARTQFKGQRVLLGLILAYIMIPPQVLMAPLFAEMVSLGLVDTWWAIILPQVAAPLIVYILFKFFQDVPPELEQAAFVDGAGRWRVFFTIVLPLSRPVLAAVSIFTFINTWNNFLWPFLVSTDPNTMTLPVGLANVVQGTFGLRYAQIMASVVLAGLPLLFVFVLFQRQIVRGVAHGPGRASDVQRLRKAASFSRPSGTPQCRRISRRLSQLHASSPSAATASRASRCKAVRVCGAGAPGRSKTVSMRSPTIGNACSPSAPVSLAISAEARAGASAGRRRRLTRVARVARSPSPYGSGVGPVTVSSRRTSSPASEVAASPRRLTKESAAQARTSSSASPSRAATTSSCRARPPG